MPLNCQSRLSPVMEQTNGFCLICKAETLHVSKEFIVLMTLAGLCWCKQVLSCLPFSALVKYAINAFSFSVKASASNRWMFLVNLVYRHSGIELRIYNQLLFYYFIWKNSHVTNFPTSHIWKLLQWLTGTLMCLTRRSCTMSKSGICRFFVYHQGTSLTFKFHHVSQYRFILQKRIVYI